MPKPNGTYICGFCNTNFHDGCKPAARNGSAAPNPIVFCGCPVCADKKEHPRCIECGNGTEQDVDPAIWTCIDQTGCQARIKTKVDADPVIQNIRAVRSSAMVKVAEQKAESAATRAPAAPKVGKCLVTGEPTKGGKFKPGMDARYVSIKVADTLAGKTTEAKVITEMQGHGLTEVLQGKFRKALGLATEKANKAKAAEAAKKAEAKSGTKA